MVYKDDPDHARLRRLVNKAFTPRMVQQMTGEIERIVASCSTRSRGGGARRSTWWPRSPSRCRSRSSRPCSASATRTATSSTCSWSASWSASGAGRRPTPCAPIPTARKLYAVLERLAEQRRAHPDDGLISALLAASEDGDSLSPDEVMAMIFLLMLAGHDTTANLIGSSARGAHRASRAGGAAAGRPGATPTAVEELLRFTTPVPCGAARTLLDDVEVDGTTMPKGSARCWA